MLFLNGDLTLKASPPHPPRFPELRSVVVLDGPQPGMFSLEELLQAGSSRHRQQLQDLQRKLSCDDPINILFTSVAIPAHPPTQGVQLIRPEAMAEAPPPSFRAALASPRLPR